MIPRSFDADTSREMIGDARARVIEKQARDDADKCTCSPPQFEAGVSYWGEAQGVFEQEVYLQQYTKRQSRNTRKAAQELIPDGVWKATLDQYLAPEPA